MSKNIELFYMDEVPETPGFLSLGVENLLSLACDIFCQSFILS